jgi:hypothetical protein
VYIYEVQPKSNSRFVIICKLLIVTMWYFTDV